MTMMHTPGPWFFDDEHEEITAEERRREGLTRIATVNLGWSEPFNSEQNANARLIAAAPELLEALKWMVLRTEEGGYPDGKCLEEARAAIAKASGEQQ